jgi:putative FmdB family regulatory protein
MPLYEYHCEPCDHTFETLVRSAGDVPRCPRCGGIDLTKLLSAPAAAQTGGRRSSDLPLCGPAPSPVGGCGAPQCGGGFCGMS